MFVDFSFGLEKAMNVLIAYYLTLSLVRCDALFFTLIRGNKVKKLILAMTGTEDFLDKMRFD